jgi:hypothetical protein
MFVEATLSELIAGDHVTSRMVTLSLNGVAQSPIDAMLSTPKWPCNPNDAGIVATEDFNSAGSTKSPDYPFVAVLPTNPPSMPSIVGVVFSNGGPVVNPLKR